MYFGDTEIFRTSTAEPTKTGIVWTYAKEMSNYLALFRTQQKIIFDLGNIVDDTYTGLWNTTLTATFFTTIADADPADIILPISARRSTQNSSSAFVVPQTTAINTLDLPRNAKKAVFSISACGQAAEEFWWSNVLTSDSHAFGDDTTLYGHSAFREVQLLIDGYLAGVAWPFPVIFTGGVVPGFWRPIVGIDAFDLREDEIDITPFLPLLSNSNNHTFEIRVLGVDDDGNGSGALTSGIESNWVVTGKVFVWLDSGANLTSGSLPKISAPAPLISLQSSRHQNTNGTVESLDYSVEVSRNLYIQSTLSTSTGTEVVYWRQNLTFSNVGTLSNGGNDQVVQQTTAGSNTSPLGYSRSFEYPLWVDSSYNAPTGGNVTIDAQMKRGKIVQQVGDLAFPNEWKTFDFDRLPSRPNDGLSFQGSVMNNRQNGTASYLSVPAEKRSTGLGNTEQRFTLSGLQDAPITLVQGGANEGGVAISRPGGEELYRRHVIASNDSIVFDEEVFGGQKGRIYSGSTSESHDGDMREFAKKGIRALLGRGPL